MLYAQNDGIRENLNDVSRGDNEHNNHPSIKVKKKRVEQLDIPMFCPEFVSCNDTLTELDKLNLTFSCLMLKHRKNFKTCYFSTLCIKKLKKLLRKLMYL